MFELHGGFTPQNAFGYCFGKAQDRTEPPQDEPPAAPTTTKPTHCPTCKARLNGWGRCEPCEKRMNAQIAQVARKFPRDTGGGCW